MLAPQRTGPLYPLHSYAYPNQGTVTFQTTIFDVNWYETWPIIRSIFVASMMVISSAAIIGLDIANLAIEGSKTGGSAMLGSGTAKVGAGIWSGSISFLAAIFIIVISKSIFHKPISISSWFFFFFFFFSFSKEQTYCSNICFICSYFSLFFLNCSRWTFC
jgi:hypothetical protein